MEQEKNQAMVQIPLKMSLVYKHPESGHSLFLSGIDEAQSILLDTNKIAAVLTAQNQQPIKFDSEKIKSHLVLDLYDKDDCDIKKHFKDCNEFIEQNLRAGNVLVHCVSGVSRSVTIVLAYLLQAKKLKLKEVFGELKAIRPIINPNLGFCRQLKAYEKQLFPEFFEQKAEVKSQAKLVESRLEANPQNDTPVKRITESNLREQYKKRATSIPRKEACIPSSGYFTSKMNDIIRSRK